MRTYLQNSLIKLLKAGERVKNASILSDTSWLLLNPEDITKIVYIFKSKNNELYQSYNGNITKGNWEFIVDSNSLVIELEGQAELYNATLLANDFLFLNKDGDTKSLAFGNFTKFKDLIKSEIIKKLQYINVSENSEKENKQDKAVRSSSPFKLLEKSNLIDSLNKIKPNLEGLNRQTFFKAIEFTNSELLYNNLADWETEEDVQLKSIARYLNKEQAFQPIKDAYFMAKKYPNYIGDFKSELSNFLNLE